MKRILIDLEKIERLNDKTFRALPDENNLFHWRGYIMGPEYSAYDGMTILFTLTLDQTYPLKPPKMNFLPKTMFHPNVYFDSGEICLGTPCLANRRPPPKQMELGLRHQFAVAVDHRAAQRTESRVARESEGCPLVLGGQGRVL